jgi:hypothetical protein
METYNITNGTKLINLILNNRSIPITMRTGEVLYLKDWDACAGIQVRFHLADESGEVQKIISVDHNNVFDYISHIG